MNHSGNIVMSLLILCLRKFRTLTNDMANTFTSLMMQFTQCRFHTVVHLKLHIIRPQGLFLGHTDESFSAGFKVSLF